MTVRFAQQPRALRSMTRIGRTGKLTPARRCSAARVCALSRATVRIPPPSLPTLMLTSVPVRCDRLSGRPTDPSAPPMRRAGGDRQIDQTDLLTPGQHVDQLLARRNLLVQLLLRQ